MAKKSARKQEEQDEDRTFAIQSARYGMANDDALSEDVTAAVVALVRGGRLAVKVDAAALGVRRKFATRCRLYVTFTVGARELNASTAQGKELRLP